MKRDMKKLLKEVERLLKEGHEAAQVQKALGLTNCEAAKMIHIVKMKKYMKSLNAIFGEQARLDDSRLEKGKEEGYVLGSHPRQTDKKVGEDAVDGK